MTEEKMMGEAREEKPQAADKKENERVARMGSGNIPALVVEFAVPAILGMLVNGAYNIIDSVFLGHGAGEIGLSAVSVATPIMTVFMAISMLIGAGGNALCAPWLSSSHYFIILSIELLDRKPQLPIPSPKLKRTGNFSDFKDFKLIAFFDVIVAFERQTAFQTGLHFSDIVLESAQ